MDQVPFGDNPTSRCRYYRDVCDLPATVTPPDRILLSAGSVGAITMPARLGDRVRTRLLWSGSPTSPIALHPRSKRWTFLVRPDVPTDDTPLFRELFRLDVHIVPQGASIALPAPTDSSRDIRHWVTPPRGTFRPSGFAVIEAISSLAATGVRHV
ncbi:DNA-directed RNA polymerase subunit beta [Nocardia colli]|uniref:DNA-directed RNA polymerase subunit beta n=1 Tax=Nocardia colli TaxID=2545717 RepID=UPI0035DD36BD